MLLAEQRIDPLTHARFAARASLDLNVPRAFNAGESPGERSSGATEARYDVLGELGEGGMGVVSLARDETLKRRVALKSLTDTGNALALRRFVREAQITAQLDHPYVVPVYDLDATGESASYAMKLVRGQTLSDFIQEARLQRAAGQVDEEHSLSARLEIFLKICDALAFAHERGVIHRDLKPDNVMLGAFRELYVVDWGLAQVLGGEHADTPRVDVERAGLEGRLEGLGESSPGETLAGDLVGTPAYMSPEQAGGEHSRVGVASDQCSLGLILHELITLEPPYPAPTLISTVLRALESEIEPPKEPGPPELAAIVRRASAKEINDRYPSVTALADDLRRHLRGVETHALPDGPRQRLYRWMRTHQTLILATGIGILFLAAGAIALVQIRNQRALERREQAIARLSNRVGRQAQRLSGWLVHYQGLTQELAGATTHALLDSREPPPPTQRFELADFGDPARQPEDAAESPRYGRRVSTRHFLSHLAPRDGEARSRQLADLRRLLTLRDRVRAVFSIPSPGEARRPTGTSLDAWIRGQGPSVHWVYLASQSGAIAIYPGSPSGWQSDYDPTRRSWYLTATKSWHERGVPHAWTRPYPDRMSGSLVVSSVALCLGPEGEPLGTAALDLPLSDLQGRLWDEPREGLERVFLLEVGKQQRVLLASDTDASHAKRGEELDLASFPFPEIFARLRGEDAGVARVGGRLVCWQRIAPVDFVLVAIVDAERYFAP